MAHILVIDDEPDMRIILKEHLSRQGHHVETACDGKDGLRLIATCSYDLVVTDIVMPNLDGLEVLTALNRKYPHIKKIVITGGTAKIDHNYLMEIARKMRADKVIAKPIEYAGFSAIVNEVLCHEIQ